MSGVEVGRFSVPVDIDVVGRDWAGRGFSCDTFVDPPGREWRDFAHACNELVTVLEGRLRLTIDGESCELGPGDEVFIAEGAVHTVKNVHSGVTRWLYGYDSG